jgi:glycosyltransferase involved in cell wall biosynthesis
MLNNKTIAVVIAAYNEEKQIGMVIETIPDFIDRIVIVNDCSKDKTSDIVEEYIRKDTTKTIKIENIYNKTEPNKYNLADILIQQELRDEIKAFTPSAVTNKNPEDSRIILINHKKNAGVGAVVASGYKWCKDHGIDCIVKIDGDGQMDPNEIINICKPVIEEGVDYVKGNRLLHRSAWLVIPRIRFLGNSILSVLTKIASGYWHVSDTQTAFTAISKNALHAIDLKKLYKSYGYPNDILVRLNIAFCTLKEVGIKPIYFIGEKSKMKIFKIILPISLMLLRSFFKRLWP